MTPREDKAFLEALGWGGPNLWLTAVPEPEVAKNRVYLDVRAPTATSPQKWRACRGSARPCSATAPTSWSCWTRRHEFCVET